MTEHKVIIRYYMNNDRLGEKWKGDGPYYRLSCINDGCQWEDEIFKDILTAEAVIDALAEHAKYEDNYV